MFHVKHIYVPEGTLVFTVNNGVQPIEKLSGFFVSYNEWGETGKCFVTKQQPAHLAYTIMPNVKIFGLSEEMMGENGELKTPWEDIAFKPERKLYIFGSDEERDWKIRDMIAEHLVEENDFIELGEFEDDETFNYLWRYLPFYGFELEVDNVNRRIVIDKNYPPCFFKKWMGEIFNNFEEVVQDWQWGGWFRTLRPVDEEYKKQVHDTGIFFQGFRGVVSAIPLPALTKGLVKSREEEYKKEKTFYKITCVPNIRIDFGSFMI